MEKYKFIGGEDVTFEHGKVYDKNYRPFYTKWTVGQLAHLLPDYWEKVEEFNYEYKWYDVREVLPDERFDGKWVSVITSSCPHPLIEWWDNTLEAFRIDYFRANEILEEDVLFWMPLPDLPPM